MAKKKKKAVTEDVATQDILAQEESPETKAVREPNKFIKPNFVKDGRVSVWTIEDVVIIRDEARVPEYQVIKRGFAEVSGLTLEQAKSVANQFLS